MPDTVEDLLSYAAKHIKATIDPGCFSHNMPVITALLFLDIGQAAAELSFDPFSLKWITLLLLIRYRSDNKSQRLKPKRGCKIARSKQAHRWQSVLWIGPKQHKKKIVSTCSLHSQGEHRCSNANF